MYDVTGAGDTVIGVLAERWQRVIRWKKPASLPMRRLRGGRQTGNLHGFADRAGKCRRGRADTGFGVMTEEELKLAERQRVNAAKRW